MRWSNGLCWVTAPHEEITDSHRPRAIQAEPSNDNKLNASDWKAENPFELTRRRAKASLAYQVDVGASWRRRKPAGFSSRSLLIEAVASRVMDRLTELPTGPCTENGAWDGRPKVGTTISLNVGFNVGFFGQAAVFCTTLRIPAMSCTPKTVKPVGGSGFATAVPALEHRMNC
jgi:hypothetical protein